MLDVEWFNSEVEHNTHQITRGAAFPVVEFTLPDGRVIRARTHTGRNPAPAKAGETVTVLYDPLRPEHVELKKNSGRDMMAPMYYVLAGFCGSGSHGGLDVVLAQSGDAGSDLVFTGRLMRPVMFPSNESCQQQYA